MVIPSLAAATTLAAEGLNVTVVNCRYIKPYDEVTLAAVLADHKHVLVVEEGTVVNGFGALGFGLHPERSESWAWVIFRLPVSAVRAYTVTSRFSVWNFSSN